MPIIEPTGITVFPFKPNWSGKFNEVIEWKTDILTSHAGNEQRRALRVVPRRSFEYGAQAVGCNTARFEAALWVRHERKFLLPVWSDPCKLTANVAAGAVALPCLTDTFGFRAGDYAVLYQDDANYEVVLIDSFTTSQINLDTPLMAGWSSGLRVFPAVLAHLPADVPTQRLTSGVLTAMLNFMTGADDTYTHLPAEVASTLYDGLEVITRQPNWQAGISNDFSREFYIADAGVGPVGYYEKAQYQRITRPYAWLLRSRDEILAFRKFLARMRGQSKSCWIPSWHADFNIISVGANLIQFSEQLDNAYWLKSNLSVTANSVAIPGGEVVGDTLLEDSASSSHFLYHNFTPIVGRTYTHEVRAKVSSGGRGLFFQTGATAFGVNQTAHFNIDTGAVLSTGGGATASVTPLADGWLLCSMTTIAATVATDATCRVNLTNNVTTSYLGNGVSGVHVFGMSVKPGSAGDYIRTTSVTVPTRVEVEGSEFHENIGVDITRDRVMVRFVNGEIEYAKITATELSGENTNITLDTEIAPNDIVTMCSLLRCRIATDKIVIPWETAGVATPQLMFTTVPA